MHAENDEEITMSNKHGAASKTKIWQDISCLGLSTEF